MEWNGMNKQETCEIKIKTKIITVCYIYNLMKIHETHRKWWLLEYNSKMILLCI